jgi:hypothetical protein
MGKGRFGRQEFTSTSWHAVRKEVDVTINTNEKFAESVLALVRPEGPFRPRATYDPDGDCIEFVAKPDSFYAERIDDLVTVYYSHETNEVIGALIKGVKRFAQTILNRYPGFAIEIDAGPVKLAHLFLAELWRLPREKNEIAITTYRKLIKHAEETKAEADLSTVP